MIIQARHSLADHAGRDRNREAHVIVHSARISYDGPDRLDVTRRAVDQARKRGESPPMGAPWAPSWSLLQPLIEIRHRVEERLRRAKETDSIAPLVGATEDLERAWSAYVDGYLAEMRVSYTQCRPAWDNLIQRERVVLVCYCTDAEHCHRYLLRTRILPALGAVDVGELQEAA